MILEQKSGRHYWSSLRADLLSKRDMMASILNRAGLQPIIPEAGYFMLADITKFVQQFGAQIDQQPAPQDSSRPQSLDYRLARWLSNEKKLQVIPASAFYYGKSKELGSRYVRFCFIKSNETMAKFEKLLEDIVSDGEKTKLKAKL